MFYEVNRPQSPGERYSTIKVKLIGPEDQGCIADHVNHFMNQQAQYIIAISPAVPVVESDYDPRFAVTIIYQQRIGLPVPIAEEYEFDTDE
jgi:hypothetical protein